MALIIEWMVAMVNEAWVPTETEQQALREQYLIDHLVRIFHLGQAQPPDNARVRVEASVYDHICDCWCRRDARA